MSYKNRQQAGFGPWAIICQPMLDLDCNRKVVLKVKGENGISHQQQPCAPGIPGGSWDLPLDYQAGCCCHNSSLGFARTFTDGGILLLEANSTLVFWEMSHSAPLVLQAPSLRNKTLPLKGSLWCPGIYSSFEKKKKIFMTANILRSLKF